MMAVILFLVVCFIIGLCGGLLYLIYLPFKKRLIKSGKLTSSLSLRINKIFILILLIIPFFQTYVAFYPNDSFYEDEFKLNTGLCFPASAEILRKTSEYPDLHGDYSASAIIKLSESDYIKLRSDISRLNDFQIDTTTQKIGVTSEYHNLTNDINANELEIVFSNSKKEWFKVAFLKNKHTIIFERSSS